MLSRAPMSVCRERRYFWFWITSGEQLMKRIRNLLIGTVSIVALSSFPLHLDLGGIGPVDLSIAHAKGGNGNGGGGNGKGGDHGNGGSHGASAGKSGHSDKTVGGKSASAHGRSKSLFSKDR